MFTPLLADSDEKRGTSGNRLFYLSTAPSMFETITTQLKNQNMGGQNG